MARTYTDYHEAKSHPYWEDIVCFAFGALIVAAPYIAGETVSPIVLQASSFLGVLICFTAAAERMQIIVGERETAREWEEVVQALASATLIALPFLAGYADTGTLRYWHFVLGGAVFLMAMVELRRDYVADLDRLGRPRS
jgi:hypothetical protein